MIILADPVRSIRVCKCASSLIGINARAVHELVEVVLSYLIVIICYAIWNYD